MTDTEALQQIAQAGWTFPEDVWRGLSDYEKSFVVGEFTGRRTRPYYTRRLRAIGFTGMDLETAVRERIPILSILFNNFSMAIELKIMAYSTQQYRSTDISGDYAAMARAFGAYGERVKVPDQIVPAIQRGIQQTQDGVPALLEFITVKEDEYSIY